MPARTVILLHTLADGSWHWDWFIEKPEDVGGLLVAFRVQGRPDDPACTHFKAVPLGDHRNVYLDYEGPVSGGRGMVRRVASGKVLAFKQHGQRITIRCEFGVWSGERMKREPGEGVVIFRRLVRNGDAAE